tara:strand:+ start:68 stop:517 length:450 start_codon:yes stop_codon:yes gene_type:complete
MKKKKYNIYIVASTYYSEIAKKQIYNAKENLINLFGKKKINLNLIEIEGALEVPFIVNYILRKYKKIDGLVTLGCLIKGKTNHFDHISKIVSDQLLQTSINFNIPITSGILSVTNKSQIKSRTDGSYKDRAIEASSALYKLIVSLEKLK